jgi:DNA-binding MarR family transcriptional regulator
MTITMKTQHQVNREDVTQLAEALFQFILTLKRRAQRQAVDQGTMAVLGMLAKLGPTRPSDLAYETGLDLSTVSRHLRTLEQDGYVDRAVDPSDRRAQRMQVTDVGRRFVDQLWSERLDMFAAALADWDGAEVRQLAGQLRRLVKDVGPHFCAPKNTAPNEEDPGD